MPYDAQNRGASGSNGNSADGAGQAFLRQGNEAAAAGDYEAAEEAFAQAVATAPGDARAL